MVSVNFKHNEIPDGYVNGLFVGAFSAAIAVVQNDAPLHIGNHYTNNRPFNNYYGCHLIFNRKLTATEHAVLAAELRPWG